MSDKYIAYLKAFGTTLTLREFAAHPDLSGIALRHDVDYDLDVALEMAFWENRHGIRSTYFILHSAPYIREARHLEKMLQIQDFGHEIGLHNNFLSEWLSGKCTALTKDLCALLTSWRDAGLIVNGTAAHGDPLCYRYGFINYWMFTELRPSEPRISETGKSAEGIRVDNPIHQIVYPDHDMLCAPDGRKLSLWQTPMSKLDLQYEAVLVPSDRYFSDSGGGWTRSSDPLKENLGQGRVQILMHPIYWQAPPKIYFFLSTARSGSKWLATVLNTASSVCARHEFMLNNTVTGGAVHGDHRTGEGFAALSRDREEGSRLIVGLREWIDAQPRDYAEINVYLPFFIEELRSAYPDAEIVFLHRNPASVFRSLINRNWYDTADDERHGAVPLSGWEKRNQFEKCAGYIAWTMDTLARNCSHRASLEHVTSGPVAMTECLAKMGIALYPRLAGDLFDKRIDANIETEFPEIDEWPLSARNAFTRDCNLIAAVLDYPVNQSRATRLEVVRYKFRESCKKLLRAVVVRRRTALATRITGHSYVVAGAVADVEEYAYVLRPDPKRHSYIVLGSAAWNRSKRAAWNIRGGEMIAGAVSILGDFPPGAFVRIVLLGYAQAKLTDTRMLRTVSQPSYDVSFSCKTKLRVKQIAIAFYMPKGFQPTKVRFDTFSLRIGSAAR